VRAMGADTGDGVGGIAASCATTFVPNNNALALMDKAVSILLCTRMR